VLLAQFGVRIQQHGAVQQRQGGRHAVAGLICYRQAAAGLAWRRGQTRADFF